MVNFYLNFVLLIVVSEVTEGHVCCKSGKLDDRKIRDKKCLDFITDKYIYRIIIE